MIEPKEKSFLLSKKEYIRLRSAEIIFEYYKNEKKDWSLMKEKINQLSGFIFRGGWYDFESIVK